MVKDPSAIAGNIGDTHSIPESGRSPGKGNGNPLHYSCLGNPTDRGAWQATFHVVTRVGSPPPQRYKFNKIKFWVIKNVTLLWET